MGNNILKQLSDVLKQLLNDIESAPSARKLRSTLWVPAVAALEFGVLHFMSRSNSAESLRADAAILAASVLVLSVCAELRRTPKLGLGAARGARQWMMVSWVTVALGGLLALAWNICLHAAAATAHPVVAPATALVAALVTWMLCTLQVWESQPRYGARSAPHSEESVHAAERAELGIQPGESSVGVALSGGGIRSATICSGSLAALTPLGDKIRFLSTVSGGGWAGGAWFLNGRRHLTAEHLRKGACDYVSPGGVGLRTNTLLPAVLVAVSFAISAAVPVLVVVGSLGMVTLLDRLIVGTRVARAAAWLDPIFVGKAHTTLVVLRLLDIGVVVTATISVLAGFLFLAGCVLHFPFPIEARWLRRKTAETIARLASIGVVLLVGACIAALARPWSVFFQVGPLLSVCLLYSGLVLSLVVSRNTIGLQDWWSERIRRAFLRARDPVPGLNLARMRPFIAKECDAQASLAAFSEHVRVQRCLHIINGAINTPGEDSERDYGVDGFEMSPLYCGSPATGWTSSKNYSSGMSYADAIAVSAAAVNAQGGRTIPGVLRPALALSNIGLGRWLRNPQYDVAPKTETDGRFRRWGHFWLWYQVREILGWNKATDSMLLVSDGGHYENLGLLALVKRRCRYIFCFDASSDVEFAYTDLSRVISLIALRAHGTVRLRDGSDSIDYHLPRKRAARVKVLDVTFAEGSPVTIFYTKSAVSEDDPVPLRVYGRSHREFPHRSTTQQFLEQGEIQAYWDLGVEMGTAVAAAYAQDESSRTLSSTDQTTEGDRDRAAEMPPRELF